MNTHNLEATVKNLHDLPTLPTILAQCTKMLKDPNVSANELAKIIKSDQSISSKVLKLVNSAFYGLSGNVSSISQAIVILGFNTVRNIILSVSIFDLLSPKETYGEFEITQLWEHTISCAVISRLFSQRLGMKDPEEAFTAGLLHDIGKVIIAKLFRQEFITILNTTHKEKVLILEAEQNILGITHPQLGELLAKQWKLPTSLSNAIAFHHDTGRAPDHIQLVSLVHLADIVARGLHLGSGGDRLIPELSTAAWDILKLSVDSIEQWLTNLDDELDKARIFFTLLPD